MPDGDERGNDNTAIVEEEYKKEDMVPADDFYSKENLSRPLPK